MSMQAIVVELLEIADRNAIQRPTGDDANPWDVDVEPCIAPDCERVFRLSVALADTCRF